MNSQLEDFFSKSINRWNYATWIDPNHFLYVENPKVGCTTIKQILQKFSGLLLPPTEQAIHYRRPPENFVDNIGNHLSEIDKLVRDGLFTFSFVRDPKTRIISAFKDKILKSRGAFWQRYRDEIRSLACLESDKDITFEHFINYVESVPDSKRDIHWRSQFALLRPDVIPYTFLGRFENFSTDFQVVIEKLGNEVSGLREFGKTNSTSDIKIPERDFSQHDEKIFSIYQQDYSEFGY